MPIDIQSCTDKTGCFDCCFHFRTTLHWMDCPHRGQPGCKYSKRLLVESIPGGLRSIGVKVELITGSKVGPKIVKVLYLDRKDWEINRKTPSLFWIVNLSCLVLEFVEGSTMFRAFPSNLTSTAPAVIFWIVLFLYLAIFPNSRIICRLFLTHWELIRGSFGWQGIWQM